MLELDGRVSWVGLPISRIHLRVAPKCKTQWFPATIHNTGWKDDCQVYHGSIEAIPIFDPVDVEEAYSQIESHYHSL